MENIAIFTITPAVYNYPKKCLQLTHDRKLVGNCKHCLNAF